ncbi:MAG TPA: hypothetical protein VGM31_14150 [Puia sp.]|jgi:hypothetical protein
MNQLTNNPFDTILKQAAGRPVSADTKEIASRHAERKQGDQGVKIILADISSSMAERVGADSKIELLRKALTQLGLDWTKYKLFAFHSFPQKCLDANTIPEPTGSTALHLALKECVIFQPQTTLVISDGQPDDAAAALKEADNLSGRIDCLYIGPENDVAAIAFMRALAARTGGKVVTKDIAKEKQLQGSTIRALLQ